MNPMLSDDEKVYGRVNVKGKKYILLQLPTLIIIFSFFFVELGLAFGFIDRYISEGTPFFIFIFFVLLLLQLVLLIPAYLMYRKVQETDLKLKIRSIFTFIVSLAASIILLPFFLEILSIFSIGIILVNFYPDRVAIPMASSILGSFALLVLVFLSFRYYKNNSLHHALLFLILSIYFGLSAYNSAVLAQENFMTESKYESARLEQVKLKLNSILNGTEKPERCDSIMYDDYVNKYISYQNLCYTMAALKFQNESICEIEITGGIESEITEQRGLCKKLVQASIANELKLTLCEKDKFEKFYPTACGDWVESRLL